MFPHHVIRRVNGRPRGRRGVALIIVLAFIVLLTGVTVAFFSLAIGNRQISNSSANGIRADIFAQDAMGTVLGDLSQEIAAGSVQPYPNPVSGSYLYVPTAPAAAVPCLARVTGTDVPSYLPNLVKRSASGVPFFSGSSYDTTNYPPSNRAANVSSISTSQNGRVISLARWNQALLLPKKNPTSDTDFTPAGLSSTTSYTPPDWILVARDGTNPAVSSLGSALLTNGTNPVVGRFAYNVYDEGGLLDANVVGFPTDTTVPAPQGSYPAYKKALAYADLKQLPGFADLPAARQEQIVRTLAGWRNFASTGIDPTATTPAAGSPVSGSVSAGYTWTSTNSLNYFNFVNLNGTGFLHAANPLLVNNQSDHFFASRQTLIDLMLNGVASQVASATVERADLQNSLQYLGTFSRDLNQPSYVPDPTKPLIAAPSAGGNDGNGGDSLSLVTATTDGRINPSFLAVRAASAFSRNDGTTAIVGEPLVKKRFALNRLAWLTYQGPSASRNLTNPSATGPDADVATLESIYGKAWLQQGTAANIKAYFGLTWGANPAAAAANNGATNCWTYAHTNASAAINTLNQVAQLAGSNAREPDFVELLKAAVCAGSLAKPATYYNKSANVLNTLAFEHQFAVDDSLDMAVIQLTANIIDQFDVDGYPTTIYFANSGPVNTQEFVGIENLPYVNRVRCMVIKAAEPSATSKGTPPTYRYGGSENGSGGTAGDCPLPVLNTGNDTLSDTGVGLAMLYPELWNPHDWNPSDVNRTLGNPRPSQFRVTAQSDGSGDKGFSFEGSCNTPALLPGQLASGNSHSGPANVSLSPGFTTRGFASFRPPSRYLSESGTMLTFSLPTDASAEPLFREPTLLLKPGVPAGSSLAGPGLTSIMTNEHLAQFAATGGGVKSGVVDANGFANGDPELRDTATQGYVGFYLGAFPLRWVADVTDKTVTPNVTYEYNFALRNVVNNVPPTDTGLTSGVNLTYRIRCQDSAGSWVAYDQKYSDMNPYVNDDLMVANYKGFFDPQSKNIQYASTVDPRTNRFGMLWYDNFDDTTNQVDSFPPFSAAANGNTALDGTLFLNRTNAIVSTQRMGQSAGTTFSYCNPGYLSVVPGPYSTAGGTYDWWNWWMTTTIGWYPGSGPTNTGPFLTQGKSLRPGLLTQNSPQVINDGKNYDGATAITNAVAQYYADPDGIVRRAMGAYVTSASGTSGLPMATANTIDPNTNLPKRTDQSSSRPVILNRPFNSVADLGYVFSGTPWKNIDFFSPESGGAALLDVFCVSDTDDPSGLTAGKVDLNTRQLPVLQAVLAGAYEDEYSTASTALQSPNTTLLQTIAQGLITRTTSNATGMGPLRNLSELVGKWVSSVSASSGGIDGSKSYSGFSGDLTTLLANSTQPAPTDSQYIQRFREASIRARANNGQTRVWNLMIDLVAQVGRYSPSASTLANFTVEGEQHCWIHVAIDRYTGRVLDQQTEIVKE